MKRSQAIARALELHAVDPMEGEAPRDATRRWVELVEDRSRPGPIRDVLCWVIEFAGDGGPTFDVYVEDATGALIRKEGYA